MGLSRHHPLAAPRRIVPADLGHAGLRLLPLLDRGENRRHARAALRRDLRRVLRQAVAEPVVAEVHPLAKLLDVGAASSCELRDRIGIADGRGMRRDTQAKAKSCTRNNGDAPHSFPPIVASEKAYPREARTELLTEKNGIERMTGPVPSQKLRLAR